MPFQITTKSAGTKTLISIPNECPNCHKSITPNPLFGHKNENNNELEVFFFCPDKECSKSFIGYYNCPVHGNPIFLNRTSIGTLSKRVFTKTIIDISPRFDIIYNQAFAAEQQNLVEICGVGYRKGLEFLIKDYAIKNNSKEQEKIEKQFLSTTIEKYVTDARIKSVAKRAVWLGNDETHYIRKWEGKNLDDLKKLIDLTIHWIEMEALTESFNDEMPD
jgi:hypothetical protein